MISCDEWSAVAPARDIVPKVLNEIHFFFGDIHLYTPADTEPIKNPLHLIGCKG